MKKELDKAWLERYAIIENSADLFEALRLQHAKSYSRSRTHFMLAARLVCGEHTLIEWDTPAYGDCTVQGVMVFYKL